MGYPTDRNGEACSAFHTGDDCDKPRDTKSAIDIVNSAKAGDRFKCSFKHCLGHTSEFAVCTLASVMSRTQVLDQKDFGVIDVDIPEVPRVEPPQFEIESLTLTPLEIPEPPHIPNFTGATVEIPGLRFLDLEEDHSAPTFLRRALGEMEARASVRDQPQGERAMARTVAIFNAMVADLDCGPFWHDINGELRLSELAGWHFMLALKLARSVQGSFNADDYADLAAYAALAGECAAASK